MRGGGFGLTAVKRGSADVTVTATGTDVSTIIEVGVAAPVAPTLPADAPAGVTLDATHVQYSTKAVKYDVPAGGAVSALVFPSHNGKTQAQRVGLWVYVDPSNLGPKPPSSSYTQVIIGRGNGGGNGAKVMGCDALTGLHAGWNLCLFDDMPYGVGMTVSFRSQNGGSIWVDSLIVNPPMPAKTTVVFTHDVNPTRTARYLAPLYAKYGLPFTWDTNNEHAGVSDQSITAMTKAGLTDWGMYSGISGNPNLPDYVTGDWSEVVNAMTDASRITGLPRASYVASTNNQSGAAYITALSNAGWPLIRCTYGGGVSTTIDPTYREVITVAPDQYAAKVDEWAGKGYTLVVTAHNVLPDDQATGSTDIKLSEFEPLLEKTKQLVDAGTVEVITMRQLAQRVAPDTLSDWDKQTN